MNFLLVKNRFISYTTTLVFLQWTVKIYFIPHQQAFVFMKAGQILLKINEDKLGIMGLGHKKNTPGHCCTSKRL